MTPQESFPEPEETRATWDTTKKEKLREAASAFAHIARGYIATIRAGLSHLEKAQANGNQERVERWLNMIEQEKATAEQELEAFAKVLEQKQKPQPITPEEVRGLAEEIKNININDPKAQNIATKIIEERINQLLDREAA